MVVNWTIRTVAHTPLMMHLALFTDCVFCVAHTHWHWCTWYFVFSLYSVSIEYQWWPTPLGRVSRLAVLRLSSVAFVLWFRSFFSDVAFRAMDDVVREWRLLVLLFGLVVWSLNFIFFFFVSFFSRFWDFVFYIFFRLFLLFPFLSFFLPFKPLWLFRVSGWVSLVARFGVILFSRIKVACSNCVDGFESDIPAMLSSLNIRCWYGAWGLCDMSSLCAPPEFRVWVDVALFPNTVVVIRTLQLLRVVCFWLTRTSELVSCS